MGLDMYAYSANKAGAQNEYWDNGAIIDGNLRAPVLNQKN